MSVVKINAIEVPEGSGPELEARFAARAGMVDNQPGFEEFMLLRPTSGDDRYFVVTRWESEARSKPGAAVKRSLTNIARPTPKTDQVMQSRSIRSPRERHFLSSMLFRSQSPTVRDSRRLLTL